MTAALRGLGSAVALATLVAWSRQTPAAVTTLDLSVIECERANVSLSRLVELVRIEIAPRVLSLGIAAPESSEVSSEVHLCAGSPDSVTISLVRQGSIAIQRHVELADVIGDSRARTLAFVVAEMLDSTSRPDATGLVAGSQPDASRAVTRAPANASTASVRLTSAHVKIATLAPERETSRHAATRLGAGLSVREYSKPGAPLFGTWMALALGRFNGELLIATSSDQGAREVVTLSNAALAASVELVSIGKSTRLLSRLRVESGASWATGARIDSTGSTTSTPALTSAAMAEIAWRAPPLWRATFEVRSLFGYSGGLTATVAEREVASTSGWILGVALGVDVLLRE